ncbi:hypothetical protein [Roseospira navarrensis]|uniref:Uncharacterized protein n=1 Tax=Roseospira navarrensis TaxID=140058 RepID=A0A7X1ZHG7_9PROT|nr:hypothetical protein [Roseospira navarrensis]MQX38621.1 hypothetical protein [Roseospira navarrensis]
MDVNTFPKFLQPTLRLFLSVDLVGSTALKQAGSFPIKKPDEDSTLSELGAEWFNEVAEFYRKIEELFTREWDHYKATVANKYDWPVGNDPEFWKINGDEIIYFKELSESRECYATFVCWLNVVEQFRSHLAGNRSPLDVKASAWLAGFPIANSEVILRLIPLSPGPHHVVTGGLKRRRT